MENSDKLEDLRMSLNGEVSKLIKLEAESAVDEDVVDQELKDAEDLESSLAAGISHLKQELAQQQDCLRQARDSRYE